MKAWLAGVLVSVVAAGSATVAIGEDVSAQSEPKPQIVSAKEAKLITRAGTVTNALAMGILLVNPKDKYKPVPLYGYPAKNPDEMDESVRANIVSALAEGKVHAAIVAPLGNEEGSTYRGKAIKVEWLRFPTAQSGQPSNDQKLFSGASNQAFPVAGDSESLVTFTRRLKSKDYEAKFITTAQLWSEFRARATP